MHDMSQTTTPLTGGDGLPRQRGRGFADNVFLLHPENQAYLSEEMDTPVVGETEKEYGRGAIFGIVYLILIFGGYSLLSGTSSMILFQFFLLFSVPFLILGAVWFFAINRRNRFGGGGKLFVGQIESATGRWEVKNRTNFYYVTITYQVRLSDGHLEDGREKAVYMDMVGKPLPERGTHVAVLYLDEYEKMLL